jgi:hypothetical protein
MNPAHVLYPLRTWCHEDEMKYRTWYWTTNSFLFCTKHSRASQLCVSITVFSVANNGNFVVTESATTDRCLHRLKEVKRRRRIVDENVGKACARALGCKRSRRQREVKICILRSAKRMWVNQVTKHARVARHWQKDTRECEELFLLLLSHTPPHGSTLGNINCLDPDLESWRRRYINDYINLDGSFS